MLQSLNDAVDGWRQARTVRHFLEILASPCGDSGGSDIPKPPLTKKERLAGIAETEQFINSYLSELDNNRAFCTGTVLYSWFSPLYLLGRRAMFAGAQERMDYFKRSAKST